MRSSAPISPLWPKIEAYAIDPGGQLVLDGTAGRLIFFAVAD